MIYVTFNVVYVIGKRLDNHSFMVTNEG